MRTRRTGCANANCTDRPAALCRGICPPQIVQTFEWPPRQTFNTFFQSFLALFQVSHRMCNIAVVA